MDSLLAPAPPSGSPQLPADQGLPATLPPYIGAVMFESWLYGLYTILFIICIYVLLRRKQRLHWVLFASAVFMFSIASADIGYTYYLVFAKLFVSGLTFEDIRPKYWLYVTNNVVADCLLLYRCYVVWGRRKHIVAGPVVLLIAGAACGYIFEGTVARLFRHAWVYLAMTFTLNTILTLLTAGRIWWLARTAHLILGESLLQRYNATITILIESGFLYSLYVVLDLSLQKHPVGSIIMDAGLIQMVGIMPTLIIVQVGLGRAVDDLETNNDTSAILGRTVNSGTAGRSSGIISMNQTNTNLRNSFHSASYRNSVARSKSYTSDVYCPYCGMVLVGSPTSPSSTTLLHDGGQIGQCHCAASNDTFVNLSPHPIQQKHKRRSTHSQHRYSSSPKSAPPALPLPLPPSPPSFPVIPLPPPISTSQSHPGSGSQGRRRQRPPRLDIDPSVPATPPSPAPMLLAPVRPSSSSSANLNEKGRSRSYSHSHSQIQPRAQTRGLVQPQSQAQIQPRTRHAAVSAPQQHHNTLSDLHRRLGSNDSSLMPDSPV